MRSVVCSLSLLEDVLLSLFLSSCKRIVAKLNDGLSTLLALLVDTPDSLDTDWAVDVMMRVSILHLV